MYSKFVKFGSIILTIALLINLLPVQVLGTEIRALTSQTDNVISDVANDNEPDAIGDATIIGESIEKRTEFSKEYRLSNGMDMIVVYPEAVHIQKNNAWEEIDNTLVSDNLRGIGTYRNKNNSWNVSLPQQLNFSNKITVEKDGYIVRFGMAGEKRRNVSQIQTEQLSAASNNTFVITAAQTASAQVIDLNYDSAKQISAYPETIADTLQSRLRYTNVYQNTDVQYDLNSYQLKESIILHSYNSVVQGYDFLLETGELTPVLLEDNSIVLQTVQADKVMTLPAPYMIDKNGSISNDVTVTLTPSANGYLLSYQMPLDWLADANRAWPVILDPIIVFDDYRQNIRDQFVAQYYYENNNHGTMYCGYNQTYGKMRTYLRYQNIPTLTSADVIVHADLSLYRHGGSTTALPIEAHKVEDYWYSETITWESQPGFNPIIEDYSSVGGTGRYYWEITDIVRDWYKGGLATSNNGVMLKAPDSVENGTTNYWKKFYTIDYDQTAASFFPQLRIYCKNNNGIEGYWDYTSTSAGRAGTGYVNNYSGNLTWIHSDIGFGGNRMPVSISHIYNTNDSNLNQFGMGNGWKTNFNQTAGVWANDNSYYFWEDGDGTKHYFHQDSDGNYVDEDGLELKITSFDGEIIIEDKNGNKSFFDGQGRLYKMQNNQETQSIITVTYSDSTSNKISTITDGVGRKYNFIYTNSLLSKISYVSTGTTELSYVTFSYGGSNLTSIDYKPAEGKEPEGIDFAYNDNNLLTSAIGVDGYKISYSYTSDLPKRVNRIQEYDGTVGGGYITVSYEHNQTTFTDHNNNVQIMQFNDWGNVISIQDGQGRAQYAQYARNNYDDQNTSVANQMNLSSKMQNTVNNLLSHSNFESGSLWYSNASTITAVRSTSEAYLGQYSLAVTSTATAPRKGVYYTYVYVDPGETITLSSYVKGAGVSAQMAYHCQYEDYNFIEFGEVIQTSNEWTRIYVSYTNTEDIPLRLAGYIFVLEPGTVYMDCVQAEIAPMPSRYNLIENGDFSIISTWSSSSGRYLLDASAAPQLDPKTYCIAGNPINDQSISQTINISGQKDDCFVLSGWATADSVPLTDESRTFGLKLTFKDAGGNAISSQMVSFNADCSEKYKWQYASGAVVAPAAYSSITVSIHYDRNANSAFFDGIQLFKETFGTSYAYDENGNVKSVVDLQNQETTYAYTQNNLTQILQGNKAKMRYEYDNYHNVTKAITLTEDANGNTVDDIVYTFTYDTYGNNTSVNIGGDNGITTSATYSDDGNRLVKTTDALEKETLYCYNEDTNVLEWVQYPNDTPATKTQYTYDELYRVKTASAAVPGLSEGTALTASYTYVGDLLTSIQTGSTAYSFTYGAFSMRTGVSIGERTLASYAYTEDLNRYLRKLTYGNDDYVEYEYDNQGRLIKETYEDGSYVTYAYDNTGSLAIMTDSATGRKTTYSYDLLDRLMQYAESGTGHQHSVTYTYDQRNNLSKLVESINGTSHTTDYTYDYENRVESVTAGGITRNYAYDNYGRLFEVEDTYASGQQPLRTYFYHDTTEKHSTQIDSIRISLENGTTVTYSYTYDSNGNILSVSDGSNTTSYAYDSANQLIRENNQAAGKTWTWSYDNAGNITSRKEYAYTTGELGTPIDTVPYTYDDASWGDLLTWYDGVYRSYDEIGNLLIDGIWVYIWENGRELVEMSAGTSIWNFTYDANGMRTGRTNGTTTYSYVYNGSQLTQMTAGTNTLRFAYDASGAPMAVNFNGTNYYYLVNLQGDVMGIVDSTGNIVVNYTYDAWGKPLSTTGMMASTLGSLNPLRYRGYVYDQETGLYYLQSRYYNPEIGRFINADGFTSTGQGLLGNNMFAYCGNNPISRYDPTGSFWSEIWTFIETAVTEMLSAMRVMSPAYAGCGGAAAADGPLPYGDIVAVAGAALITTGAIVYGFYQAAQAPSISIPEVDEKSEAIVIPKEPDSPVVFPSDPNTFNPIGLAKVFRPGTKNGAFISWMDPLTNTEVFRWDENPKGFNGPHYHINGTGHYYPNDIVPEPYATVYFPHE